MGAQQIGLERDAISIPTGKLQDWLQAGIQQQATDRKTAHPHDRTTAIGHVDGMNAATQAVRHGQRVTGMCPSRRHHFRRDRDAPLLQNALQRRRQTQIRFGCSTMQDQGGIGA